MIAGAYLHERMAGPSIAECRLPPLSPLDLPLNFRLSKPTTLAGLYRLGHRRYSAQMRGARRVN